MSDPLDLTRDLLVVATDQVVTAVQTAPRHLRKIIVPHAKREFHEVNLPAAGGVGHWQAVQPPSGTAQSQQPVIESQLLQLSWVDHQAAQKPHWHQQQIETYASQSEIRLVFRSIDDPASAFQRISLPAGRVFVPPRVCHLVQLTGLTEVLQVRVPGVEAPIDLEQDQVACGTCPHTTSCAPELAYQALTAE